jgi:putative flippase GtrA
MQHPLLKRFLESRLAQNKLFRYFISAGLATWVDITVYFLSFNYLYQKSDISLFNLYTVSAATASLFLSYTMGLLTNFAITRYLVFNDSELEFHKQLFRYVLVALLVLAMNWLLMRLLIRGFDWWPTLARATSALTVGMMSFVIHKTFSFRTNNKR